MSEHSPIEPPDDWLAEQLAGDRDVPAFDAARATKLEQRLAASIAAGDLPDLDPIESPDGAADAASIGTAAPLATATASAGMKLAVATGLVGFVVGIGAGWFGHAVSVRTDTASPTAERVVVAPRIEDAGVATSDVASATATGPEVAVEPTSRVATAPASRDAGRPTAVANRTDASVARDDELADENALITQAQSALARGRAGEALAAVREHQRRFPGGRFTEEREAIAIQALARSGDHDAASARAERFFARYPNSFLTRAVRAAVDR